MSALKTLMFPSTLWGHLGLSAPSWPSTCEPVHLLNIYFYSCTCFLWLCNKSLQTCLNTRQNYHLSFCGSGILVQCNRMLCSGPYKAEIKSHLGLWAHLRLRVLSQAHRLFAEFSSLLMWSPRFLAGLWSGIMFIFQRPPILVWHMASSKPQCVFSKPPGKSIWFVFLSSRTAITRDHLIRSDPVTFKEVFFP